MVINEKQSKPVLVNSEVPQSSVLEPMIFIIFINEIVDSTTRLFAGDTLLYLPISCTNDTLMLQNDLEFTSLVEI